MLLGFIDNEGVQSAHVAQAPKNFLPPLDSPSIGQNVVTQVLVTPPM